MKKLFIFAVLATLLTSCLEPRRNPETNKEYAIQLCEEYSKTFDKYCLSKFDGYIFTSNEMVSTNNIYIKENYPDLYEKYIKHIEQRWDSLKTVESYSVENERIRVKTKNDIKIKNSNIITNSDNAVVNEKIKTINKEKSK